MRRMNPPQRTATLIHPTPMNPFRYTLQAVLSMALLSSAFSQSTLDGRPWLLRLEHTGGTTLNGVPYRSSTRLLASWPPSPNPLAEHRMWVVDEGTGECRDIRLPGPTTEYILEDLKAETVYTVELRSVLPSGRVQSHFRAQAQTPRETWQLRGTGNTMDSCDIIVSDGNVLAWPILYGADAPAALAGRVRLYYKIFPKYDDRAACALGITSGLATSNPDSVAYFDTEPGFGLRQPNAGTPLVEQVAATHGVPMSASMGGGIRLFFEAKGKDKKTRYMYLDSQDGEYGQDFHPDSPTIVQRKSDYNTGGPAEPTLVIGVKGNPNDSTTGMINARQSKMGWPNLDQWRWDGKVGTFIVVTGQDSCGTTTDGLFHGKWNGSTFDITQDAGGCPIPVAQHGHGPVLQHLGDYRYKLYWEDSTNGKTGKPLHQIYANAALTGSPTTVELGDFESEFQAREVDFLWPDGTLLDVDSESALGDHAILCPDGTIDVQVMYLNLTPVSGPFVGLGMAVLLNP